MALETVEDYVAEARTLLQDLIEPYRYTDAELLSALNMTLLDVRRLRPDLFLGDGITTTLDEIEQFAAVNADEVDIEQQFRYAVLFGVCASALLRDSEDDTDQRAGKFLKLFRDKLLTLDI